MKNRCFLVLLLTMGLNGFAQSGIGSTSPNADASLELGATNKGLLINRVALTTTNSPLPLSNHVEGMIIYNTKTDIPNNLVEGMYLNIGTEWKLLFSQEKEKIPTGVVEPFAGPTIPVGWLRCNGQAVNRIDFGDLFAEIGVAYGVGNGNTTFNVPDLRGEFIRGFDDRRGIDADAGRTLASNQDFAIENIIGETTSGIVQLRVRTSGVLYLDGAIGTDIFQQVTLGFNIGSGTVADWEVVLDFDASRVVNTSTETRPRNVAMNYIIKY